MARTRIADRDGLAAVRAASREGSTAAPDRAMIRLAVKYSLQTLTDRAPGNAVEVRIPPFAAVQAVPGPVHRRGTPSAVVEMDASTWLALATGELAWDAARAAGRVRASGQRADLSAWLPLVQP